MGFVLLRIRFVPRVCTTDKRASKQVELKAGHEKGGREGRERESRERKGLRVELAWGEKSFFLSFRQHRASTHPLVPSRVRPPFLLLFYYCHCCYALLCLSLFFPPLPTLLPAVGRETVVVQLMEVTKVEVVLSFKVATSHSRKSRARVTPTYCTQRRTEQE